MKTGGRGVMKLPSLWNNGKGFPCFQGHHSWSVLKEPCKHYWGVEMLCVRGRQCLGWWNWASQREPGARGAQSDWQLGGCVGAVIPSRLRGQTLSKSIIEVTYPLNAFANGAHNFARWLHLDKNWRQPETGCNRKVFPQLIIVKMKDHNKEVRI